MTDLEALLAKALEPFAGCVFNDNGDMTVDSSGAKYDDFIRAYFVCRRADRAVLSGSPQGETAEEKQSWEAGLRGSRKFVSGIANINPEALRAAHVAWDRARSNDLLIDKLYVTIAAYLGALPPQGGGSPT